MGLVAVATTPARGEGGPVIAIPSRPGIPVVINGCDASYATVYGDWGLSRPGAAPVVGRCSPPVPNEAYRARNSYYPTHGRPPKRGRNEIEPGADRELPKPAENFSRSWTTEEESSAAGPTPYDGHPYGDPGRW